MEELEKNTQTQTETPFEEKSEDTSNRLNKFITYDEDKEQWNVETKQGVFVMEELNGDDFLKAREVAMKVNKPMELILGIRSIVSDNRPSETELGSLKASTLTKIINATGYIYELKDFQ